MHISYVCRTYTCGRVCDTHIVWSGAKEGPRLNSSAKLSLFPPGSPSYRISDLASIRRLFTRPIFFALNVPSSEFGYLRHEMRIHSILTSYARECRLPIVNGDSRRDRPNFSIYLKNFTTPRKINKHTKLHVSLFSIFVRHLIYFCCVNCVLLSVN